MVYSFIQRGYNFDRLYNFLFVRPAKWVSEVLTAKWIDRGLIDGILHVVARGAMALGSLFRKGIDVPVINGGADLTGRGIQRSSASLRRVQTGQVQQYMVMSVFVIIIAAALALVFIV